MKTWLALIYVESVSVLRNLFLFLCFGKCAVCESGLLEDIKSPYMIFNHCARIEWSYLYFVIITNICHYQRAFLYIYIYFAWSPSTLCYLVEFLYTCLDALLRSEQSILVCSSAEAKSFVQEKRNGPWNFCSSAFDKRIFCICCIAVLLALFRSFFVYSAMKLLCDCWIKMIVH